MTEKETTNNINRLLIGLLLATLFVVVFNSYQLSTLSIIGTSIGVQSPLSETKSVPANIASVMPTGIPNYGEELGISFDDVSSVTPSLADKTIGKLKQLDKDITLEGDDLKRYISIASNISCEYCCGAKSLIFGDGRAACGCAHSYSMRGLAKYLITAHGEEYTDDQILEEMGKWKTLYFPAQIQKKAEILQEQGEELNYVNLASNKFRGVEKKVSGSSMVGGC